MTTARTYMHIYPVLLDVIMHVSFLTGCRVKTGGQKYINIIQSRPPFTKFLDCPSRNMSQLVCGCKSASW